MSKNVLEKIKSFFSVDNSYKVVITSLIITFFVGFATYSSFIVNGFVSPDGIIEGTHVFFNQAYHLSDGGRWLNVLTSRLHADLIPYWLLVVECLLLNWLNAHTINKIINNKNKILYCIICAMYPVFPIIAQAHTYTYSIFPGCFGTLLSIMFVYLNLQNNIYLSIAASIILGTGMGSVQAYIGIPVALTVFCMIKKIIEDDKDVYRFTIASLLSGLGGGIVYVAGLNIFLKLYHIELSGRIAAFSVSNIFTNFFSKVPEIFKIYFLIFADNKFKRIYVYLFLLLVFVLEVLGIVKKLIKEKRYVSLFITLLLISILPVCFYFISIIYPQSDIHGLMRLPNYISLFLAVGLKDYFIINKDKLVISMLSVCFLFLTWTYVLSANATFDSYRLAYNVYKERFSSALDEVYELEDFRINETKIIIIGYPSDEILRSNIHIFGYADDLPERSLLYWSKAIDLAPYTNYQYLLNEFGIDTFGPMEIEEYISFIKQEECKNMPSWPEKGYVQMIDGNAVIKFCEVYE